MVVYLETVSNQDSGAYSGICQMDKHWIKKICVIYRPTRTPLPFHFNKFLFVFITVSAHTCAQVHTCYDTHADVTGRCQPRILVALLLLFSMSPFSFEGQHITYPLLSGGLEPG